MILLSLPISSSAQNYSKVLGLPIEFKFPLDDNSHYKTDLNEFDRSIPWVVICDRTSQSLTTTYTEKEGTTEFKHLKFKDKFYVLEEEEEWIRIGSPDLEKNSNKRLTIVGSVEDFGWIKKENMLLWTSGLLDDKTQIHKKAFLLNKKDDIENIIKKKEKQIVNIYAGPKTQNVIGDKTIYEFYFVLKKEKGKYLLAKESKLLPNAKSDWADDLIGWVDARRLTEWNSRICLEPNFGGEAFNERKNNSQFQLRAYADELDAIEHAQNGTIKLDKVEWDNDPVKLDPAKLADKDPRRYKGGVVRFPMLGSNSKTFYSGVIGEIHAGTKTTIAEVNYSSIISKIGENELAKGNYSVFFLIEGTESMNTYRRAITNSIKEIKTSYAQIPNVRFGAAVYRDGFEKEKKRQFDLLPLTDDSESVIKFVNNINFGSQGDNDPYTCLHYGVDQALSNGGFVKGETNIVYVIGNYGDYSGSALRVRKAMVDKDATLINDIEPIVEKLSMLDVHLVGVQCKRDDGRKTGLFTDQCEDLMLESAKAQYNLYKQVNQFTSDITLLGEDNIRLKVDKDNSYSSRLIGGAVKGYVAHPSEDGMFNNDVTKKQIVRSGEKIFEFVNQFWKEIDRVIDDGASFDNISSGEFAPAAAKQIMSLLEDTSRTGYDPSDIQKLASTKYKLYTSVYLPKHINKATEPTYSYVLFMPEDDLSEYCKELDKIVYALDGGSTDELRRVIHDMFIELLQKYTGNDNLKKLAAKSTDEVRRIMHGLGEEGLGQDVLTQENDFVINEILHKKKMTDDDVYNFANGLMSNELKLRRILKKGSQYEFSYTSGGNTYFWIPLDWTF